MSATTRRAAIGASIAAPTAAQSPVQRATSDLVKAVDELHDIHSLIEAAQMAARDVEDEPARLPLRTFTLTIGVGKTASTTAGGNTPAGDTGVGASGWSSKKELSHASAVGATRRPFCLNRNNQALAVFGYLTRLNTALQPERADLPRVGQARRGFWCE
jgi:hypothetical protein